MLVEGEGVRMGVGNAFEQWRQPVHGGLGECVGCASSSNGSRNVTSRCVMVREKQGKEVVMRGDPGSRFL